MIVLTCASRVFWDPLFESEEICSVSYSGGARSLMTKNVPFVWDDADSGRGGVDGSYFIDTAPAMC